MAQVWLITGSGRGLGRAIAEAVLAAGDKLIASARNPQQLSDLVGRYGDNVRAVALDVTDERAAIATVQLAVDVFGRLDVLVNNAGYGNLAAIEDMTLQDFRAQLETNLFGAVNLTKAAIPVMRRQGAGRMTSPVIDLEFVTLAIAVVAPPGQRTLRPFEIAGAHVVEHEAPRLQ